MGLLDCDRLFPQDPKGLGLARALFSSIRDLPIVSPHGHTDPAWFAKDEPFENPAALFVTPDHYICRMLNSYGIALENLGIKPLDGANYEKDPREIWKLFASH